MAEIARSNSWAEATQKIRPFLWFLDQAEAAANFYVSIFDNAEITYVARYGKTGPGTEGDVMLVTFVLDGQEFMALNGLSETSTPAFYINCKTQEEVDKFWERLSEGGEKGVCGWLKDRYGVNWNVVPERLGELMQDEDAEKSSRVMQAMLEMTKLDIAGLERAYAGGSG
jgi:predicted 3-demethylubiquinone-9 3-methyltransferase (glyoxalase superfamily)